MALSVAQVYRLSGDQLRLKCEELGFDAGGTVRELRSRLADHIMNRQMDETGKTDHIKMQLRWSPPMAITKEC
jgi:hypothetical protein